MRYGDKMAVDGLDLDRRAAARSPPCSDPTAPARPPRWRPARATASRSRARSRCSGSTRSAQRRDLLPRIGVMLQDGGAWSGVRAMEMLRPHRPAARPPARRRRCSASGSGSATAAARPTDGSPAASSSGSSWRWRSSAGRSWSSSTSRPRGWTRRRGVRRGSCSSELRADGVTVVLTTHHMDEAERLADQIHIIDRGRMIASGTPLELTRGGTSHDPAGRHQAVPRRRARRRCRRALGHRLEVTTISEVSLLITGPADSTTLATVSAWCERAGRAAGVAQPRPAHPRGRLPGAHRAGARRHDRHLHARRPAPLRWPGRCSRRRRWSRG